MPDGSNNHLNFKIYPHFIPSFSWRKRNQRNRKRCGCNIRGACGLLWTSRKRSGRKKCAAVRQNWAANYLNEALSGLSASSEAYQSSWRLNNLPCFGSRKDWHGQSGDSLPVVREGVRRTEKEEAWVRQRSCLDAGMDLIIKERPKRFLKINSSSPLHMVVVE